VARALLIHNPSAARTDPRVVDTVSRIFAAQGWDLEVAGTTRKASVLLTEGVGDFNVPNNATRSLAWNVGPIPHLAPIWDPSPILEPITGPVTANIDSETTAAFYQFVPAGIPGIPVTQGCEFELNGHFCAQVAPAARLQRALFLRSAVDDPVPTIVDPLTLSP